jgi:hypothetical protein
MMTKGNRLRKLREEFFQLVNVIPKSPPRAPRPVVVKIPVEPRQRLAREKKKSAVNKMANLQDDLEDRLVDYNEGWKQVSKKQRKGAVSEAIVTLPEVVVVLPPVVEVKESAPIKKRKVEELGPNQVPSVVKAILGMINSPQPDETLADISFWRDLIPELRKCKPEYWQYFKEKQPVVWNIYWILRKFRSISLLDVATMAAELYATCEPVLTKAIPKIGALVLESGQVDAVLKSYVISVLEMTNPAVPALVMMGSMINLCMGKVNAGSLRSLLQGEHQVHAGQSLKDIIHV